jgi:hypothetical protein
MDNESRSHGNQSNNRHIFLVYLKRLSTIFSGTTSRIAIVYGISGLAAGAVMDNYKESLPIINRAFLIFSIIIIITAIFDALKYGDGQKTIRKAVSFLTKAILKTGTILGLGNHLKCTVQPKHLSTPAILYISDDFIKKHWRSISNALLIIFYGLMLYLSAVSISGTSLSVMPFLIAIGAVSLLVLDGLILHFRVSRGYFGFTAVEASELLAFMAREHKAGRGPGPGSRAMRDSRENQTAEAKTSLTPGAAIQR